jgi:WD40 repeat protein
MKQKGLLMLLALAVIMPMANNATAKTSTAAPAKSGNLYTFPRSETPNRVSTWNTTAYSSGLHEINTLAGSKLYHIGDTITDFVVSPTGNTIAVVQKKKTKSKMRVIRTNEEHNVFQFNTKKYGIPKSVAYMSDARQVAVAAGNRIYFLETKKFEPKSVIENVSPLPERMVTSDNGYFLAAVCGDQVNIYNLETRKLRKNLNIGEKVVDVDFSPGSSDFGVLTDDGVLTIYNTRTFEMRKMIDNLGTPGSFSFNLDGKYVAVSTDDTTVDIINLLRDTERETVDVTDGGASDISFITDANNNTLLVSTMNKGVMVRRLPGLEPYYSQLINEEADRRMDEWMKMMPNETMEQYKARVTEESMKKHRRLIEDEISTDFASGLMDPSKMSFG